MTKNVGKWNVADSLARWAEVPACNKVCKIASKACVYSQFSGSWASLETGNTLDLILPPTLTQTFTATISQFPMLTKYLDHLSLSDHQTQYCVTRAPLLYFIRSWVALSFKVCEWVRHPWHLSRSPLCSIYKGINALYWPSIINYQLLPPNSVLYWPSTQLHHLVTHSWANWI